VRTAEDHLVEDAGEQFLEHLGAAGQQAMEVAALRHTSTGGAFIGKDVGQGVALHHRYRVVELAQRTRGQQTGDARSQYHRMCADLRHRKPPLPSVCLTKALLTARRGRR
jgi:hypothetical protein